MHFTYYQDQFCYYLWKTSGIPSSFGKEKSFLDLMIEEKEQYPFIQSLFSFFGTEGELGLMNRLDNDTSGLLYFAKNPAVKKRFKELQSEFMIHKYYLAEVYGDIREFLKKGKNLIDYPIMHHRFSEDRMIVIKEKNDEKKGKGKKHYLVTKIVDFAFLEKMNTSVLLIEIQKGIRHQIRVHLSSIGYPICGDEIYCKASHQERKLQLFSVGVEGEDKTGFGQGKFLNG